MRVAIRIKPPGGREEALAPPVDRVYNEEGNGEIYRDIVSDRVAGRRDLTLFTYGHTNSGKTHTMFGAGEERGIVAMVLEDILREDKEVTVGAVEIYNENVLDLLGGGSVVLRDDGGVTKMVNNRRIRIRSTRDIEETVALCTVKRHTSSTSKNISSSRSHTVIEVVGEDRVVMLVDLAGSEKTGGSRERAVEGLNINKSLLSLGKVIDQLRLEKTHVSFRESKLTRVLQRTLSGGAVVAICTVEAGKTESANTVKFAVRVKSIKEREVRRRGTEMEDALGEIERLNGLVEVLSGRCRGQEEEIERLRAEKLCAVPLPACTESPPARQSPSSDTVDCSVQDDIINSLLDLDASEKELDNLATNNQSVRRTTVKKSVWTAGEWKYTVFVRERILNVKRR